LAGRLRHHRRSGQSVIPKDRCERAHLAS
jgi:hypothetical protein